MNIFSDLVYLGHTQDLVQSEIKCEFVTDDTEPMTMSCEKVFDDVNK